MALHSALCWCHTIAAALDKTACTSWLHLLMLLARFDHRELERLRGIDIVNEGQCFELQKAT